MGFDGIMRRPHRSCGTYKRSARFHRTRAETANRTIKNRSKRINSSRMDIIMKSNRGIFSLRVNLMTLKKANYRNARLLAALSNVQNWSLTNFAQQAEHLRRYSADLTRLN